MSRLSKTRFTTGLQCHKRLWWTVHEPDAPELEPDAAQQAIFDQGTRVGLLARDYVPGGMLIDLPHHAIAERVKATAAALAGGATTLYEASFLAGSVFVAVDILRRGRRGFTLTEVKSSTLVKPEHLPDAAIQAHVLQAAGLEVERVEIMHLNRACTHPDLSDLFARADVTRSVGELLPSIPGQVRAQLESLAGPLPEVAIGDHCSEPYECPFRARCWPELPPHHVGTLYHARARAAEFEARGWPTIDLLPAGLGLRAPAERQRRAVREGRMIVEPGLAAALAAFVPPLAHLDFETVNPAIPVWNGCHPYDAVPVQFSVHLEDGQGGWHHREWIAGGPADPRPELAHRLVEACRGARTVVAYNKGFESSGLRLLATAVPALAGGLMDIERRLVDPLPLVRDYVYHPDFGGSFSLKRVLPALVPGEGYEGLEIAGGELASVELARLIFEGDTLAPDERERLRAALLRYCGQDTWGLVRLLDRLRELARG